MPGMLKCTKAKMGRIRPREEEHETELEGQPVQKKPKIVKVECTGLLNKTDDLERTDQRLLPKYKSVQTYIPTELLGDAFMLREFMYNFASILSGIEVFSTNLSFYEMTRALTVREVGGPLADIIIVLLGTIFELHRNENDECPINYLLDGKAIQQLEATRCHFNLKRRFGMKISELPLNAFTLSEVLRLHLLSSGATVEDCTREWRKDYRNGYKSSDDPGLALRTEHPHILHSLKMCTLYGMPYVDIMTIIRCLMAQILTYANTLDVINARTEDMAKVHCDLHRIINDSENIPITKEEKVFYSRNCVEEDVENIPEPKRRSRDSLNKRSTDKLKHRDCQLQLEELQLKLQIQSSLFSYVTYLGMDRAYRKYYIFESMPGLFVEHPQECMDTCLCKPPTNNPPYFDQYQAGDKNKSLSAKKPGRKQLSEITIQKKDTITNLTKSDEVTGNTSSSQYELLMCTGNAKNCIVHSESNSNRQSWSYLYEKEHIDALIDSLNTLGERESALREQLIRMRPLLLSYVRKCPVDMLSVNKQQFSKFKTSMMLATSSKYTNFGFVEGSDINDVMHMMLIKKILQFELELFTSNLGRLNVRNIAKWRHDMLQNTYNPQCKIQYSSAQTQKYILTKVSSDDECEDEPLLSEDDNNNDSKKLLLRVRTLSSALLQVEQGIDRRFLKKPFGTPQHAVKNKDLGKWEIWECSLMKSVSYSQVFMHLHILYNAIIWPRSCQICRRVYNSDEILLMYDNYQMNENNWYCPSCVKNINPHNVFNTMHNQWLSQLRIRRLHSNENKSGEIDEVMDYLIEDENTDDEKSAFDENSEKSSDSDSNWESEDKEDEKICVRCFCNGGKVFCEQCNEYFHMKCLNLKLMPQGSFTCRFCKAKTKKAQAQ